MQHEDLEDLEVSAIACALGIHSSNIPRRVMVGELPKPVRELGYGGWRWRLGDIILLNPPLAAAILRDLEDIPRRRALRHIPKDAV
jgi:hypothetical protein